MEPESAQIIVGGLGIAGTLAASVLTQTLSRRAERERSRAEDEMRWLPDRLALATEFLSLAGRIHRKMYDAAAFHNAPDGTYEDRPKWLAGHMNMLATPENGIVGLTAEDRNILLEYQHEVYEGLQEMEDLVSRIVLLASHKEGEAAGEVHEALWDVEGDMEIYAPGNLIFENLRRARAAIDKYGDAARVALRIKAAPSIDERDSPAAPEAYLP